MNEYCHKCKINVNNATCYTCLDCDQIYDFMCIKCASKHQQEHKYSIIEKIK